MIFFAGMPLFSGLMKLAIPFQICSRYFSFSFFNCFSFLLFLFGGILLNLSFLLGGAPDAGWTSYASLAMQSSGHGVDFYIAGLQIAGAGTLMGGINFIATIVNMRAPGMTYLGFHYFFG